MEVKINCHEKICAVSSATFLSFSTLSQKNISSKDNLYKSFEKPTDAVRPGLWRHRTNGSIDKEGIQKNLAWLKRFSKNNFQNLDAKLFTTVPVQMEVTK